MSNQHYLPASYIGRFSTDTMGAWRKRHIWVQRVGIAPYRTIAENVGRSHRIYDRQRSAVGRPATVDESWKYEPQLPAALNALSKPTKPLDGRTWAQVLVPFVSSLFIRGLDFKKRYEKRIPGITGPSPDNDGSLFEPLGSWHDNTIDGGQIEWQRLLTPTMAARWIVLHGSGAPILSTNDVAHCLTSRPDEPDHSAYAIPLDPATLLVIDQRLVRRLFDWDGQKWLSVIEHKSIDDSELLTCREAIQHGAFKEVYGPTKEAVAFPKPDFEPVVGPLGPGFLQPSLRNRSLIPYLEDYFRVLTMLSRNSASAGDGDIDWSVVGQSWGGIVQMILNAPRFPGGVAVCGNSIYLDLTRFSIEDVEQSLDTQELPEVPLEPSPALRALLEKEGVHLA